MNGTRSTAKELVVSRSFDVRRLPEHMKHLECYSWIQPRHILIESNDAASPFSVFRRHDGRLVCSCPEAQVHGFCNHQQALNNGLWTRVAFHRRHAVLTCTEEWCRPRSAYVLSLAKQPRDMALVEG